MGCGRKIGPYDCCSVVHGDCVELIKRLNTKSFDAVVTDPPYGIGRDGQKRTTGGHGGRKAYEFAGWDSERPPQSIFDEILRVGCEAVIWGGNYFADMLPATGKWFVWDKGQRINQSDGELAWTTKDGALRIFTENRVALMLDGAVHPTQKPVSLMTWCLQQIGDVRNVLDPFCGSGSTLVAARKLGIHHLGFEMNENYCSIARRRLDEIDAQPTLFQPKPEQMDLMG